MIMGKNGTPLSFDSAVSIGSVSLDLIKASKWLTRQRFKRNMAASLQIIQASHAAL